MILIPLGIYRCWELNDRFSFTEHPISHASKTHTRYLFTFYVTIIALVQTIFLFYLFAALQPPAKLWALPLLCMGALLVSGVVHSSYSKLIHRGAVVCVVAGLIIWSLLWHHFIYTQNALSGILGFVLTGIVLIGCPALHLYYKNFGMSELLFAAVTVLWNGLMLATILIFF